MKPSFEGSYGIGNGNGRALYQMLSLPDAVRRVADKVWEGKRITVEEGLLLYSEAPLAVLGTLANHLREKRFGKKTFFNRNFHLEPTNRCVFDCKFCSYARNFQPAEDAWELTAEQMLHEVLRRKDQGFTEVHIVGGVHPKMSLAFFEELIKNIRLHWPELHIKAFTAVELEYMFRKARVSEDEGLRRLQAAGVNSLPGGGAEIFHPDIRNQICADKADAVQWLQIHETAHRLGMPSNCTMLYGHVETYYHRLHHMELLRQLQDRTGGFNCFIPLKFRNQNNEMSAVAEVPVTEDLRCYAMARIFLDNIPHLKAYWPMIGRHKAQLLLSFGVDDLDGTIDDTTRIYSMAGAEEQHPALSTDELVALISEAGFEAVERDSLYGELRRFAAPVRPKAYA
ncbi:MAG: CofH family radical SAM protein [Chitinophagales bacterium]|nr:CofH family radical SAM protein [Chitinophagales bacterium]MDW8393452.1 CofH family radical SAM protein [Chitinophagales bacterium]